MRVDHTAGNCIAASARAQLSQVERRGGARSMVPQETIAFDGARAASATRVALTGTAGFIGWEILCLGRPASGETYTYGEFVQRFEIWRDGAPLWWERNALVGGTPVLHAPWGMADRSVVATLVAVGRVPGALPALRELLNAEQDEGEFSVSQLRDVLVCRYLGNSAEQARTGFIASWRLLRPALWKIDARAPHLVEF
jgi:urease accessory protein